VQARRIARRDELTLALDLMPGVRERIAEAKARGLKVGVERGLTDREVGIVVALRDRTDVDRDGLARRLGMSPNTLRVHLTRIRSKLGVGAARGDTAILAAARGQETSR